MGTKVQKGGCDAVGASGMGPCFNSLYVVLIVAFLQPTSVPTSHFELLLGGRCFGQLP